MQCVASGVWCDLRVDRAFWFRNEVAIQEAYLVSDQNFASAVETLIGGTADTIPVCAGAGEPVLQKTIGEFKTIIGLNPTDGVITGGTLELVGHPVMSVSGNFTAMSAGSTGVVAFGVSSAPNACVPSTSSITFTTGGISGTIQSRIKRDSGTGSLRVCSNAGLTVRDLADAFDAAITCSSISASSGLSAGAVTFAVLNATTPTATLGVYRITDRGNKLAYPDGTNWRFVGDDAIIS